MENIYSVIMAGGIGSRFWPLSTSHFPKQFHDILGTGETLIQQTFRRLRKLSDPSHILVVTHIQYAELVQKQLPELPIENIILEPARRNTAPCITYAAYRIAAENPDGIMLVAPADHLITNEKEFVRVARIACREAVKSDKLFTLGIKPHRPDTGYGYIQFVDDENNPSELKKVKTFTEKPNAELARQFLESGEFLWNSGIFIWSVSTFMKELHTYLPDLYSTFQQGIGKYGSDAERPFIEEVYPSCENESIDYGLMEKSQNVYVIPSEFGWSDLGTWGSLHAQGKHDNANNSVQNEKIITYDTANSLIRINDDKIAVIEGLDGYIVIDQSDALLICKMENEQLIKAFVNDVKLRFGEKNI